VERRANIEAMSAEYKKGFDEGFEFALTHFDATTGKYFISFPYWFTHRGDIKSCGFGEGLISGRSEKISITYGSVRGIHWENGRAIIDY
jgi:hypothetical protein